ncbi:hypothetical protein [Williamsia sp.]|uniref:hypothetical protein n=1 Tax=Williamsia sp. TaxID=1872085 RepID=UPI002F941289
MARDVNGNPIEVPRWKRLADRFGGGRKPNGELSVDDSSLVITAECFDDAEAASTTLSASRWRQDDQAVLRHLLAVPGGEVEAVLAVAAQDHYQRVSVDVPGALEIEPGQEFVALARVQLVDALHVSQERSRMAGLAQRHDGTVIAWQVLQPG